MDKNANKYNVIDWLPRKKFLSTNSRESYCIQEGIFVESLGSVGGRFKLILREEHSSWEEDCWNKRILSLTFLDLSLVKLTSKASKNVFQLWLGFKSENCVDEVDNEENQGHNEDERLKIQKQQTQGVTSNCK